MLEWRTTPRLSDVKRIPRTWELIDARFPRGIAELVGAYFIDVQVPVFFPDQVWARDADIAGSYELCSMERDGGAKRILRRAILQGHIPIVEMMMNNGVYLDDWTLQRTAIPADMCDLIIAQQQRTKLEFARAV